MNILQLYRKFEDSGPGTQPLELGKRLREWGHHVTFCSSGGVLAEEMEDQGFSHVRIPTLALDKRDPVSTIRNVIQLKRLIDRLEIDIVHGHNAASTFCAYTASYFTRTKPRFFQSVRGLDNTRNWRNWIYRIPFAHFFAVCKFTKDWLVELGVPSSRITVSYNGVDTERFDPRKYDPADVRNEFGIPDNAVLLGHVGAFSGGKGQHLIVRAVAELQSEFPDVYALLVGDGRSYGNVYYEKTMALAKELGVEHRCQFAGFRRDIPRFQSAFDLYCQPSTKPRGEMFPNAILEAMSMGNPWIGSDVSGIPELAEGETAGLLCRRDDYEHFRDKLRSLLADKDHRSRLGKLSREAVLEKYSIERVARRILAEYESGGPSSLSVASHLG